MRPRFGRLWVATSAAAPVTRESSTHSSSPASARATSPMTRSGSMSDLQPKLVGARVRRVEDPRFLTGQATYVDDVRLPGVLEVAFLRSSLAHADIESIDTAAARARN